jgi:hypothetical protein
VRPATARGRGRLDETDGAQHRDRPGDRSGARPELLAEIARGQRLPIAEQERGQHPRHHPLQARVGQRQRQPLGHLGGVRRAGGTSIDHDSPNFRNI